MQFQQRLVDAAEFLAAEVAEVDDSTALADVVGVTQMSEAFQDRHVGQMGVVEIRCRCRGEQE